MSTVASRVRIVWPVGRSAVWVRDPSRALMILQIAAIVVLGAVTVLRFHIFAEVDERAHLAYVREVAEHGRIPWVGRDHVSWQELAIEAGTYPRASGLDPRLIGLRGSSYEGWQPPLYYILAAPAYLIPSNYRDKILAVRAFDLLLLVLAIGVLVLFPRYLNPMLAPFVLFTAWAWERVGTEDGPLLRVAALSSCIVGLVWVYMAGAYYFTHAGATLGIHAS